MFLFGLSAHISLDISVPVNLISKSLLQNIIFKLISFVITKNHVMLLIYIQVTSIYGKTQDPKYG